MSEQEMTDMLDGLINTEDVSDKSLENETELEKEVTSDTTSTTKKKTKILPPKENTTAKKKLKPKQKQQKSPDFSVLDCVARSKKLFRVPPEIAKIALKHQGYSDTDLITLDRAKRIISNFLKKEVK